MTNRRDFFKRVGGVFATTFGLLDLTCEVGEPQKPMNLDGIVCYVMLW